MSEQEAMQTLKVSSFENQNNVFFQYKIQRELYLMELTQVKSDTSLGQIIVTNLDILDQAFNFFKKTQNISNDYFPEVFEKLENRLVVEAYSKKTLVEHAKAILQSAASWYIQLGERVRQQLLKVVKFVPAWIFSSVILLFVGLFVFVLLVKIVG